MTDHKRFAEEEGERFDAELSAASSRFKKIELTSPLFLNTVPKCGTLLLRNILLSFVGFEQTHGREFVTDRTLRECAPCFDPQLPRFSWGHLNLGDEATRIVSRARVLVMVRDPYTYVLSMARFLYSYQHREPFGQYVKTHELPIDRVIALVIFGNLNAENYCASLRSVYLETAMSWLGREALLVRYEDLIRHIRMVETPEAETYFRTLISFCGLGELPSDWRERVVVGSDPKMSSTARENLAVWVQIPDSLSDAQKSMVEVAAPGLRRALGYEW